MSMGEFLTVYANIILEFLMELYIFCLFFFAKLEGKENFVVRILSGFAGMLIMALPVTLLYQAVGMSVWGRVLVYTILFTMIVLHAKLCYRDSAWVIVFCSSMAYAAQNLMYKLFLIFWCYVEQNNLLGLFGDNYALSYRVIYYSFMALAILLLYFTFIKRIVSSVYANKLDRSLLILMLIILTITLILCSVEDIYFAKLSVGRENYFDNEIYYILRQTGNIFCAICCAVVLLLASKIINERELKQEVAYLTHSIKQGERQYEISKDTMDFINIKIHDIKYKINSVLAEHEDIPREELDELRKSIRIYDANIETGNELLNVFIMDKSLYCEQNGITLSCMVDGSKLEFMEAGDLYCLFGNIMDNALESVIKIQEKEKRVINLSVKAVNNMLFIQSENYYTGELQFEEGLPQTTKEDADWHGFGLKSIKMIVQKYGGELSMHAEDGVFHLSILFADISDNLVQNVK